LISTAIQDCKKPKKPTGKDTVFIINLKECPSILTPKRPKNTLLLSAKETLEINKIFE